MCSSEHFLLISVISRMFRWYNAYIIAPTCKWSSLTNILTNFILLCNLSFHWWATSITWAVHYTWTCILLTYVHYLRTVILLSISLIGIELLMLLSFHWWWKSLTQTQWTIHIVNTTISTCLLLQNLNVIVSLICYLVWSLICYTHYCTCVNLVTLNAILLY